MKVRLLSKFRFFPCGVRAVSTAASSLLLVSLLSGVNCVGNDSAQPDASPIPSPSPARAWLAITNDTESTVDVTLSGQLPDFFPAVSVGGTTPYLEVYAGEYWVNVNNVSAHTTDYRKDGKPVINLESGKKFRFLVKDSTLLKE